MRAPAACWAWLDKAVDEATCTDENKIGQNRSTTEKNKSSVHLIELKKQSAEIRVCVEPFFGAVLYAHSRPPPPSSVSSTTSTRSVEKSISNKAQGEQCRKNGLALFFSNSCGIKKLIFPLSLSRRSNFKTVCNLSLY